MRIDEQQRMPRAGFPDPTTGLGIDRRQPVAVEVEQVVVAAPPRPVAGVQQRLVVDVRCRRAMLGDLLQEPLPAVGVHHRIDQHDQLVEQIRDLSGGAGDQVVEYR